ncbi:MAG: acylphosphatase [Chloroflexi bacterium]|nr:acylphosphatase [Chloroflexota bacterium]
MTVYDCGSDSSLASLHALVRGLVQGVYFRAFVRQHATALGLTGYVRNLPHTGAVEVKAEGERSRLEELLKHLRRGPVDARVERVEVEWGEYSGDFLGFIIRH